jgi:transketolase
MDATTTDATDLAATAQRIREHIVEMCAGPPGAHIGGSLSVVEVLAALYFAVLRLTPDDPHDPDRDIFVLSKGHAAAALYATLAERGFLPVDELATYGRSGGRLSGHPSRRVPGVELPTGSLGHGLPLALGFALGARASGSGSRAYCLMGDGELQEGSVWEAAMCASTMGLDRLVAVIDRNGLQITGSTEDICGLEPLARRWESFGWGVVEVDGHDVEAVARALDAPAVVSGRPTVVIAHTRKGKGVRFMEGRRESHFAALNARQIERARAAVRAGGRP